MSYKVVQPQKTKTGERYYLYEVTAEWDSEKKRSRQKRKYLGACDKDGNLFDREVKKRVVKCSPIYGPYFILKELADQTGLTDALIDVYGERDGKRLLALAILGVVEPCSVDNMEEAVDDTYLRELIGMDWSFEQSGVCRFLIEMGKDSASREELFQKLRPNGGCVIFDIVCLGSDSEGLEYVEPGRKTRLTGSRQMNLGMVHSMEDGLPFCYRTYPGSIADVVTLNNIVADLKRQGCDDFEMVIDRGFFSTHNIKMMMESEAGFTVPIPAKYDIHKHLISASVSEIESPMMTDVIGSKVVRGFEAHVRLNEEDEFVVSENEDDIRAVVLQDDERRNIEISTLYSSLAELENKLREMDYDEFVSKKLTKKEQRYIDLLELAPGADGKFSIKRKRKAISAKENACGRFALLTTSKLIWLKLMMNYRERNDVEYDFSLLQSDMFTGITGKSLQDSAEGGLLVNFLSLRLRLTLLKRMKECGLTDELWVPKFLLVFRKLKMSCVGGEWRLNEVTKTQREYAEKIGTPILRTCA